MPKTKDKTNSNHNNGNVTELIVKHNRELLAKNTKLLDTIREQRQEITNHKRAILSWQRKYETARGERDVILIQAGVCLPAIKRAINLPFTGDKKAIAVAAERIEKLLEAARK